MTNCCEKSIKKRKKKGFENRSGCVSLTAMFVYEWRFSFAFVSSFVLAWFSIFGPKNGQSEENQRDTAKGVYHYTKDTKVISQRVPFTHCHSTPVWREKRKDKKRVQNTPVSYIDLKRTCSKTQPQFHIT